MDGKRVQKSRLRAMSTVQRVSVRIEGRKIAPRILSSKLERIGDRLDQTDQMDRRSHPTRSAPFATDADVIELAEYLAARPDELERLAASCRHDNGQPPRGRAAATWSRNHVGF